MGWAGTRRDGGGQRDLRSVRPDSKGRARVDRRSGPAVARGRSPAPWVHPRVLRARGRDVGRQAMIEARAAAGDRTSPPRSSRAWPSSHTRAILPRGRDRESAQLQGPPRGVHPASRQGAHGGQARPRGHPRRRVRRAAPPIVHGRRDEAAPRPNTLAALAALADEGYVAQEDAEALADAYRFLRRLEHRLQMVRDLQTHDLPPTGTRAPPWRGRSGSPARRAPGRVRPDHGARPRDPRAAVLPAAPGGVRRSGPALPGHDREATEAPRRARVRPAAASVRIPARLVTPPRGSTRSIACSP